MKREFENDQILPQNSLLHIYSKSNERTKEKEILNKKATEKKPNQNIFELGVPDRCLLQPW